MRVTNTCTPFYITVHVNFYDLTQTHVQQEGPQKYDTTHFYMRYMSAHRPFVEQYFQFQFRKDISGDINLVSPVLL